MTTRSPGTVGVVHARSTPASGTVTGLTTNTPRTIWVANSGNSARIPVVGTEPCPLPTTRKLAERNATEGSAAVGPAADPT